MVDRHLHASMSAPTWFSTGDPPESADRPPRSTSPPAEEPEVGNAIVTQVFADPYTGAIYLGSATNWTAWWAGPNQLHRMFGNDGSDPDPAGAGTSDRTVGLP